MTETTIEDCFTLMTDLVSPQYREEWYLAELRREFMERDFVALPNFFSAKSLAILVAEEQRIEKFAVTRQFNMSEYDTPRNLKILGAKAILRESPSFCLVYVHYDVVRTVESIVQGPIYPSRQPDGFIGMNYLVWSSATQGWHLDDGAFAFCVILEAPPRGQGGQLESIRHWSKSKVLSGHHTIGCIESGVKDAENSGRVNREYLAPGTAYILRSDKCLHRVSPLDAEGVRRVSFAVAYEATPNPQYGNTAKKLYGE